MAGSYPRKSFLSNEQLQFYNTHGYLVIKGLISKEILDKCRQRFVDICDGSVPKGNIVVMKEINLMKTQLKGEKLINKIQDIFYDSVFTQYIENPGLLDIVIQLIGANIMVIHSMLINKPPGTGRHPPHQDIHYFPFRPANKIVAAWTAMERVDRDNGCLYIVPGSHKANNIYKHAYLNKDGVINKAFHGILDEDTIAPESSRLHLVMEEGDTVFFHPMLVHGSGPNNTQKYRKAISSHYARVDCECVDVYGTVQDNIAKELESIARKKGFNLTFKEIAQLRSKIINYNGNTSHL